MRRRLDAELVRRGLAADRSEAAALVAAGRVLVGGAPATNTGRLVGPGEALRVEEPPSRYVGRGALKLERALEEFALDPLGLRALDGGASTGGFTDVLLQNGASEVVALDVGHGQLHERIRRDDRVVVLERTNLRHVGPDELGTFAAVVADLSFISLEAVLPAIARLCAPDAWLVLLVKPQFEVAKAVADRARGVILDPSEWLGAIERVVAAARSEGLTAVGLAISPIRGASGNVEFLLHLVAPASAVDIGAEADVAHDTGFALDPGKLEAVVAEAASAAGAEGAGP